MKVSSLTTNAIILSSGRAGYRPKVSIVTPTYCRNAEGLLLRCVDSATVQTFEEFEHIVIDDGSTDGSERLLMGAAKRDDRIVYIRHQDNCGLPAVRTNEGIMYARGDAIAFLFDDNILEPTFIEKAWAALQATGADVVLSNVKMLTKHGKPFLLGNWPQSIDLIRNLNTIPNGGVLVRRTFFEEYGLYDPHLMLRRVCDWDLWLRAMRLGAKFVHLDVVGAVEAGLVSPNSLGNTVAWDVKVVYGYMHDERLFRKRSEMLRPSVIADVDVLDPEPFFPYVRGSEEWADVVRAVYDPFFTRYNSETKGAMTNRTRAEQTLKWFLRPTSPTRYRVLVLSNAVNAFVAEWMNVLRETAAFIAINAPEWNFAAFSPGDIDLLVLFDCSLESTILRITQFREAGVPIVFASQHGFSDSAKNGTDPGSYAHNEAISTVFGTSPYFAQPGSFLTARQKDVATQLGRLASHFIGAKETSRALGLSCNHIEWPPIPGVVWQEQVSSPVTLSPARDLIFTPPVDYAVDQVVRPCRVSLNALVQVKQDRRIITESSALDRLPPLERYATLSAAKRNGLQIFSTSGYAATLDHEGADPLYSWIRDFSKVAIALRGGANPGSIAVFLNSEMFSGSEVYGLQLALHLNRLGMPVHVFVPKQNIYGDDSDFSRINSWLQNARMPIAEKAPYSPGAHVLHAVAGERHAQSTAIDVFLRHRNINIAICSGFMPVFALNPERSYSVYMALFQASAYDARDLLFLKGRIDGILSDSNWSHTYLSGALQVPSRVVRTALPLEGDSFAPPSLSVEAGRPIQVAVGGTLQPRKRQLEAVVATALLRDAGIDIDLNLYGYELSDLQGYIGEVDTQIGRLQLGDRVHRHGLISLREIAAANDIVLSASIDESLPQTLLELMRLGLIGTGVLSGGIDEVLQDGKTGYLTRDASAHGIAELLRRAVEDRPNWHLRRSGAQHLLQEDFSHDAARSALASLLLEGIGAATVTYHRDAMGAA